MLCTWKRWVRIVFWDLSILPQWHVKSFPSECSCNLWLKRWDNIISEVMPWTSWQLTFSSHRSWSFFHSHCIYGSFRALPSCDSSGYFRFSKFCRKSCKRSADCCACWDAVLSWKQTDDRWGILSCLNGLAPYAISVSLEVNIGIRKCYKQISLPNEFAACELLKLTSK